MSSTAQDAKPEIKESKEKDEALRFSGLSDVIEKTLLSDNLLIQIVLKQEQAFRARIEEELNDLVASVRKLVSERNLEHVKKATLDKLATDLELLGILNEALTSYKPKDTQPCHYTKEDET